MKSLLIAIAVSAVFALFFTAFLLAPAIVIGVAYAGMLVQARRSRRVAAAPPAAAIGEAPGA